MDKKTPPKKRPHSAPVDPHAHREAEKYENPIPSREFILAFLEQLGQPQTHEQLVALLHLESEDEIEALRRRLIAMCRDGQMMQNRRQAFIPLSSIQLHRGRVIGHREGYGFLALEEGGDDLYLSASQMRKVFDGDVVTASVAGVDSRGRKEGVIVEILQRNTTTLVGRYFEQAGSGYVVPDNRRNQHDILIPATEANNAQHGQFVVIDILEQPQGRRMPVARVIEVLGDHLAPGMEIDIAIRSHAIPNQWSDEALAETEKLNEEVGETDKQHRIDIRHLPLVTIDGEDAKDFDDAVYCERLKKGGWRLIVAIADVSHYVTVGSALDKDAVSRGNSVYFPEFVVPMLPEKISNGLCSLKPQVDRLCMVCDMYIDAHGQLGEYQFYEAVMHSHARLTYNLVGKMLTEGDEEGLALREKFNALVPHIDELHHLYQALKAARHIRGAIEFETTETRIVFNAERKIQDIVPVVRNDAHKLIEECMLCANVATAQFLQKHKIPALYRVHEGPTANKIENLRSYLSELGFQLGGGQDPTPEDYLEVMQRIADRPDAHLIQVMLLRSMSQAVYQPENRGHFGLNYPAYTHFTSPIRRYPDLMVHRAIRSAIRNEKANADVQRAPGAKPLKKAEIYPYDMADLLTLGEQCSMTERRADDATREVMDFLKCEFMRNKLGEEFDGIISSVTNFGFFVQLTDLYVEGLVHVSNLHNDFFVFDPVHMQMRGERTGVSFRMGDEVTVKVSRVDLDDRKIDFEMVGLPQAGFRRGKKAILNPDQPVRKRPAKTTAAAPEENRGGPKRRRAKGEAKTPSAADKRKAPKRAKAKKAKKAVKAKAKAKK
ncbi:MAG: ribonuclease R [Oceanospirillaceae bacterium]|nr:ribonuclease R [Oceanospirillaceae bacterium]